MGLQRTKLWSDAFEEFLGTLGLEEDVMQETVHGLRGLGV